MSNPFDFFDKIYCINLPDSKKRWAAASREFKKVGILNRVERIWARPPEKTFQMPNLAYAPGEFGVWLSQVKALTHSMCSQDKNFLLFEDDVEFVPNTHKLLSASIASLPDDWDIFYVGGRPDEQLTPFNNTLAKTNMFFGGYAYAINARAYTGLIDKQFNNISKPFPHSPCDVTISEYGKANNGYCAVPPVCSTVKGISVIRNANRNYNTITDGCWKKYL